MQQTQEAAEPVDAVADAMVVETDGVLVLIGTTGTR